MSPLVHPPPLPQGKEKHHIVVLEGIHAPMPTFSFPHTITIHPNTTPAQIRERIKDATIAISCVVPITPSDMDHAPHLGCLAVMAVGISWVNLTECARRGITVTKCPGGNVDAVGEHFLGLYFAVRKRTVEIHNIVTTTNEWVEKGTLTRHWPDGPPRGARQETLAIMGYGTLGKRIEHLARAIGFGEILISERKGTTKTRNGRVSFTACLERATVLAICLPLSQDTLDLISHPELSSMSPSSIIINVARGGIVNEAALATVLRAGTISGAATDVHAHEPGGIGSSPLLPDVSKEEEPVPNLTVSSHIAWFTRSTIENYQRLLKEGVEGWVGGTLRTGDDDVHKVVVVHDGRIWNGHD